MSMHNRFYINFSFLWSFLIPIILLLGLIFLIPNGGASAKTVSEASACSKMVKTFKPGWAPRSGWHIECVSGGLDADNPMNKNVLGITFPRDNFIFIRNDISESHALQDIIIHEWTHAAVSYYGLKRDEGWRQWVKYVNGLPNHSDGYFGRPEEVLAENTARCSLGYYYNYLSTDKASCHIIHKLFPKLTTVQNRYDFGE